MSEIENNPIERVAQQTRERYQDRFDSHGVDAKALGWGTREQQETRFNQLLRLVDFDGLSVLDVGCGFGDLKQYFDDRGIRVDYHGIDLCPDFIQEAKNKHNDATFIEGDIFTLGDLPEVDVVIMLGLMNFRQTEIDNKEYCDALIRKSLTLSRRSVVCDFISNQRPESYPEEKWIYYYSPDFVVSLASRFTSSWALLQDYPCIPQREMMLRMDRE